MNERKTLEDRLAELDKEQLDARIIELERRADENHQEWSRLSNKRFGFGAFAVLVGLLSLTGFVFRMDAGDLGDIMFTYAGVPVAIFCGVRWFFLNKKYNELLDEGSKITDEQIRTRRRLPPAHGLGLR